MFKTYLYKLKSWIICNQHEKVSSYLFKIKLFLKTNYNLIKADFNL